MDPFGDNGVKPEVTSGNLEISHIRFSYPSRANVCVLDNFSLRIPAGKVTALVVCRPSGVITPGYWGPANNFSNIGGKWLWKEYNYRFAGTVVQSTIWNHSSGRYQHRSSQSEVVAYQYSACAAGISTPCPQLALSKTGRNPFSSMEPCLRI
jgi:hypothetical protein